MLVFSDAPTLLTWHNIACYRHIKANPKHYLRQVIGTNPFICDGANFAIIMADKTEGYAKRRAVIIKGAFKEARFEVDGAEFANITCSVGTAEVTNNEEQTEIEETLDRLYNVLCDRLYQAKASGGDYVVGSPKAKRMP